MGWVELLDSRIVYSHLTSMASLRKLASLMRRLSHAMATCIICSAANGPAVPQAKVTMSGLLLAYHLDSRTR